MVASFERLKSGWRPFTPRPKPLLLKFAPTVGLLSTRATLPESEALARFKARVCSTR
jgi:hypothetical protein